MKQSKNTTANEYVVGDIVLIKGYGRRYPAKIKQVAETHVTVVVDGSWHDFSWSLVRPYKRYILKPGNKRRTAVKKEN